MDYKVANFGVDKDIVTTFNSLDKAEGIRNHMWGSVADKPVDAANAGKYNFSPTLDSDIIST
jgi:hypothetical protein